MNSPSNASLPAHVADATATETLHSAGWVAAAAEQIEQLAACHLEASNNRRSAEWERKANAHAYGAARLSALILRAAIAKAVQS